MHDARIFDLVGAGLVHAVALVATNRCCPPASSCAPIPTSCIGFLIVVVFLQTALCLLVASDGAHFVARTSALSMDEVEEPLASVWCAMGSQGAIV